MLETKPKLPKEQTVDGLVQSLLTISPKYGSLRLGLYVESALANSQIPQNMARAIETSVSKYIELAARREISLVELSFALDGRKTVQPVIWFVENGKAFVYDPLSNKRFKPSEFKPLGGMAYVLEVVARWTREEPPFLKFADANNPVEQLKKRFGIEEERAQAVYGKLEQIRVLLGRDRVLFYSKNGEAMRLAETASEKYGAKFGMGNALAMQAEALERRKSTQTSRGGVMLLPFVPGSSEFSDRIRRIVGRTKQRKNGCAGFVTRLLKDLTGMRDAGGLATNVSYDMHTKAVGNLKLEVKGTVTPTNTKLLGTLDTNSLYLAFMTKPNPGGSSKEGYGHVGLMVYDHENGRWYVAHDGENVEMLPLTRKAGKERDFITYCHGKVEIVDLKPSTGAISV